MAEKRRESEIRVPTRFDPSKSLRALLERIDINTLTTTLSVIAKRPNKPWTVDYVKRVAYKGFDPGHPLVEAIYKLSQLGDWSDAEFESVSIRARVGTIPNGAYVFREARWCKCGCGRSFIPNVHNHFYFNREHRNRCRQG